MCHPWCRFWRSRSARAAWCCPMAPRHPWPSASRSQRPLSWLTLTKAAVLRATPELCRPGSTRFTPVTTSWYCCVHRSQHHGIVVYIGQCCCLAFLLAPSAANAEGSTACTTAHFLWLRWWSRMHSHYDSILFANISSLKAADMALPLPKLQELVYDILPPTTVVR